MKWTLRVSFVQLDILTVLLQISLLRGVDIRSSRVRDSLQSHSKSHSIFRLTSKSQRSRSQNSLERMAWKSRFREEWTWIISLSLGLLQYLRTRLDSISLASLCIEMLKQRKWLMTRKSQKRIHSDLTLDLNISWHWAMEEFLTVQNISRRC